MHIEMSHISHENLLSSLGLQDPAGWDGEKGKRKGREVEDNLDLCHCEKFHHLQTLW